MKRQSTRSALGQMLSPVVWTACSAMLIGGGTIWTASAADSCGPGGCPCAVEGVCIPSRPTYGYFQPRWRKWPGTELLDVAPPGPVVPARSRDAGTTETETPSELLPEQQGELTSPVTEPGAELPPGPSGEKPTLPQRAPGERPVPPPDKPDPFQNDEPETDSRDADPSKAGARLGPPRAPHGGARQSASRSAAHAARSSQSPATVRAGGTRINPFRAAGALQWNTPARFLKPAGQQRGDEVTLASSAEPLDQSEASLPQPVPTLDTAAEEDQPDSSADEALPTRPAPAPSTGRINPLRSRSTHSASSDGAR